MEEEDGKVLSYQYIASYHCIIGTFIPPLSILIILSFILSLHTHLLTPTHPLTSLDQPISSLNQPTNQPNNPLTH